MPVIKRIERFKVAKWPSLIDLVVSTNSLGTWYVVARSELGKEWLEKNLAYSGAARGDAIPIDYRDVGKIVKYAQKDGMTIVER